MLGLSVTLVNLVCGATGAERDLFDRVVSTVFDPEWNLEHRVAIGAVILVVLFLSGVGLPLPEDIPLTLAGFTLIKQAHDVFVPSHFVVAFFCLAIPILSGDMIAYHLGRKYGLGLTERFHFLRRVVTKPRLNRVQHWFDRYHAFSVFMGRQVAGIRFVTFFTAGSMRVPLSKFVAFDFLGCLVSVPVWLTLGAFASRYGEPWLRVAMQRVGNGILIGAVVLIALFYLLTRLRKRHAAAAVTQGSDPGR